LTLLDTEKIDYVVSTSTRGRIPTNDSVQLRRKAVERDIPCLTSIDTANTIVRSLMSRYSPASLEVVDCNRHLAKGGNFRRVRRILFRTNTGNCYQITQKFYSTN
jgi:hypothetical protein